MTANLAIFGILPREIIGLRGVFFGPLLHGNLLHLVSNSVPIMVLGTVLFFFYRKIADKVFFYSYFGTGSLVWIFGRPFLHIGASGLIYSIAFFLFFIGFSRKDITSLIISIATVIFYGGIIYGMLPGQSNVSYESHLCGAIVGTICAFTLSKDKKSAS